MNSARQALCRRLRDLRRPVQALSGCSFTLVTYSFHVEFRTPENYDLGGDLRIDRNRTNASCWMPQFRRCFKKLSLDHGLVSFREVKERMLEVLALRDLHPIDDCIAYVPVYGNYTPIVFYDQIRRELLQFTVYQTRFGIESNILLGWTSGAKRNFSAFGDDCVPLNRPRGPIHLSARRVCIISRAYLRPGHLGEDGKPLEFLYHSRPGSTQPWPGCYLSIS